MKFVFSSRILKNVKYWIINDPTKDRSVKFLHTLKFEITVTYLRRRLSTFWKKKNVEKSGEISYWIKRCLSEYVPKVVKQLIINALYKSLMEIWLIYHRE